MAMENLHVNALPDGQVNERFLEIYCGFLLEWIVCVLNKMVSILY